MSVSRAVACTRVTRWIYPALDGTLGPRRVALLEAHLAGCDACRGLHEREAVFRTRIASAAAARPLAPASLHARLREALLPDDAAPAAEPGRARRAIPLWRWAVALAAAVAFGVLLVEPLVREGSSTPALILSVAAQQAALVEGRLPLEVVSGSSEDIADWLEPRVGFPVDLPAAAGPGVDVVGARLTELAAAEAAAVLYQVDGRPVTLFTFPAATLGAADRGGRTVEVGEKGHRFHLYRLGTLTVTLWARGAAGYALAAPAEVEASRGCAVCHLGDEGRRFERALGAGPAPR